MMTIVKQKFVIEQHLKKKQEVKYLNLNPMFIKEHWIGMWRLKMFRNVLDWANQGLKKPKI